MTIRIVKMTFDPSRTDEFLQVFDQSKHLIRNFPGCERLELLRQNETGNVFMTYSWWRSLDDLENYRHSDLFKSTWAKTKVLFIEPPQAWSMNQRDVLV